MVSIPRLTGLLKVMSASEKIVTGFWPPKFTTAELEDKSSVNKPLVMLALILSAPS